MRRLAITIALAPALAIAQTATNYKPFTFIHMNISTRMNVNPVQYEPTAEII